MPPGLRPHKTLTSRPEWLHPQLFVPAPIDLKRLELVFKAEVSEELVVLLEPKDQIFGVIVVACVWEVFVGQR